MADVAFADKAVKDLSYLARWASIALREQLKEIQRDIPDEVLASPKDHEASRNLLVPIAATLYHDQQDSKQKIPEQESFKVGIVGAGAAGLFTGMIFDHLKETYQLDVEYEILEVSGDQRLGGRMYSYYFTKPPPGEGNHEYYDVGAMRFPDSDVMEPTFALFKELHMDKYTPKPGASWDPKPGQLVPYFLRGLNTVELYNDVQVPIANDPKAPSATGKSFKITGLPEKDNEKAPDDIIDGQIQVFIDNLKNDPKKGWLDMIERVDKDSVRQYFQKTLAWNTTEWLETYSYGTAWYDQALSELVLESANFEHKGPWYCVEGGTQELPKRMFAKIENTKPGRVSFKKKVTKMEYLFHTEDPDDHEQIGVLVAGEKTHRTYDAVFNSAPLGSMQRMDLRGLNLNWGTKQAIRSLGYGASCKVGIRFKEMWWMTKFGIKQGGVSKTDLPIRMCVYPSYNIHDNESADPSKPKNVPGVLLCSYNWSMEAQRLGTLINRKSPEDEDELKALLLDNLAKLHTNQEWPYEKLHALISDLYDTHYAYDWYSDTGTTGAFAYFGPGQFRNMFPYIVRNDGTHIIIGEAASAHHAWVVGAIESAVRGVYQFLYKNSKRSKKCHEVLQEYNADKVQKPYGPIPHEFDRTKDVEPLDVNTGRIVTGRLHPKWDPELVSGNGELLRQGVQVEEWRKQQKTDRLDPTKISKEQVGEFTVLAT